MTYSARPFDGTTGGRGDARGPIGTPWWASGGRMIVFGGWVVPPTARTACQSDGVFGSDKGRPSGAFFWAASSDGLTIVKAWQDRSNRSNFKIVVSSRSRQASAMIDYALARLRYVRANA